MTYKLPRKVRRAIANVVECVNHKTLWVGDHSDHQKWKVTGGNDMPSEIFYEIVEVSVAATPEGVVVKGRDFLETKLAVVNGMLEGEWHADANLQNERNALGQVLAVLKAAATPAKVYEEHRPL